MGKPAKVSAVKTVAKKPATVAKIGKLKPKLPEVKFAGPWTHSRLRDFETCKFQFRLRHIDKRMEGSSPALERGSRIHEQIEGYLNGWIPKLPEEVRLRRELANLKKSKPIIEQLWAHDDKYAPLKDQWDKSAYVRAKLDALHITDDRARVIDFKTGRVYPANDDQVRFYGMLGLMRSERDLAQLELWYVDHDLIKTCEPVVRKDIPALQKDFTRRATIMYSAVKFPAEPGLHCRNCPYRRTSGGPCEF